MNIAARRHAVLSALLSAALAALAPGRAATVSLDDGNITFEPPPGFTELTPDEIARKFPMRNGPLHAFGDETRGASISYAITQNAVPPDHLPELRQALTSIMMRIMPNLEMVKSDFIKINDQRWVILETITPAADQKIHNIEIATPYRGVMLILNFNSDERLFSSYRDELWASLQSVKIKDNAAAQADLPSSREAPVSADQEVARGKEALSRGDLNFAREAFRAAILLDPTNSAATAALNQLDARSDQLATNSASSTAAEIQGRSAPEAAPSIPEGDNFQYRGWTTTNVAIIGSTIMLVGFAIMGTILFVVLRSSKKMSPGSPRPIHSPPPMR
jgi:hypothetical protein